MIYLIPTFLSEDAPEAIPPYILSAIRDCQVIFAENERTTRRFFKALSREIVIESFEWYSMERVGDAEKDAFHRAISAGKHIGILSEAGCPGVADPGQKLVAEAHRCNATVKPLVGPSSVLLALMASGFNGQLFTFHGYLPIESAAREKKIRQLEEQSAKSNGAQIFIETPYRNNQLMKALLDTCRPSTLLCVAVSLTSPHEWIRTQSVKEWKNQPPELHKKTAIFLLQAAW